MLFSFFSFSFRFRDQRRAGYEIREGERERVANALSCFTPFGTRVRKDADSSGWNFEKLNYIYN